MTILEALLFTLVVLFALALGAAIPALLELRRTLKVAHVRFERGAERVGPLLDQLERTTVSLQRVSHVLDVTASVGQAVGPAVAAFISAWRETPLADPGPGDAPREKSSTGNGIEETT